MWLGQPSNAIFIPLIAAIIPVLGALIVALMGIWTRDWQLRRISVLEKLVSLSKEIPELDKLDLQKTIQFEIDSEIRSRKLPSKLWFRVSMLFYLAVGSWYGVQMFIVMDNPNSDRDFVFIMLILGGVSWLLFMYFTREYYIINQGSGRRGKFLPPEVYPGLTAHFYGRKQWGVREPSLAKRGKPINPEDQSDTDQPTLPGL